MKALEKAAKDRGEAQPQAAPTPTAAATATTNTPGKTPAVELTLEPLQADTPAPAPESSPPPPKTAATAQTRSSRNQARAATVMQAGSGNTTAAATSRGPRIRPMMAFGLVAGVLLLALAIYVYLQITNPGLFIRRSTPTAPPPAPLAQAPQPQAPIATSTIIKPAAPAAEPAASAPVMAAPRESREPQRPAATQAPARPPAEAPRNKIQISAGSTEPKTDNNLVQAYAALQSGKLDTARQYYSDAARNEPRNVNALLGLAAVAMQEGRTEDASRIYFDVLDLEPRNTYAQAGLIALMGRADPVASEARLKQLIDRTPAASLHFTLGNLYADQSRWSEAQHAYFQAYQMESANPDYAYNLAVGLEHVGQPKLAANYYQRAVDQARVKGRAGFNPAQAQDRLRQLAAQPQ